MRMQHTLPVVLAVLFSTPAIAEDHASHASGHAAQSGSHASASAGHSIAASGQVTSAASAIPLSIGGAALSVGGAVSMGAAHDSARAAASPVGKPLPITDEIITVMPPNEALKSQTPDSDKKKSDKPI